MNDESLEKMGDEVRRVIGDQPDEERRRRQRAAVAALESPGLSRGQGRPSRLRWLVPMGLTFAAVAAVLAWPDAPAVENEPVATSDALPPAAPPVEQWLKAPKDGPMDIALGSHAHGILHAGGKLRIAEQSESGARLVLESGRVELEVDHGQAGNWIVLAGPYEARALGTRFLVDWFPLGEDLAVEVTRGEVGVTGGNLGPGGMVVEAGKVLEANLRDESATLRSKREVDLELSPPRFAGRIPDVDQDPVLARTWASYYLRAHPEGDQIDIARELFLRSFADEREHPDAAAAAQGYLEANPDGPHAALAREILGASDSPPQ